MNINCTHLSGSKLAELNESVVINGTPIPKGFRWDGASIRGLVMALLFLHPWHEDLIEAGLWHDLAYRKGFPRIQSDAKFAEMYLDNGKDKKHVRWLLHRVRGYALFIGLACGGWKAYNKYRSEEV